MQSKQLYITSLWTVIIIVIAIFVFFNRKSSSKKITGGAVPVSPLSPTSGIIKVGASDFVLITLNDLLVSTDDGQLVGKNVIAFLNFIRHIRRVIVMYTVPEELETSTAETQILAQLDSVGLFDKDGIERHRVIITETNEGRVSVARQIQPVVFIDSDSKVIEDISGKVPNAVLVNPDNLKKYLIDTFGSSD